MQHFIASATSSLCASSTGPAALQYSHRLQHASCPNPPVHQASCRASTLPLFASYALRSNTPAGAPVPQLLLQPLDLSDLVSVRRAAGALLAAEPGGIHMLILNAGVMACPLMWVP